MLKKIRVIVSIVLFLLITFFFIDFTGFLPDELKFVTKIQFIPALLSFNLIVIGVLVLITILFGRVYCSSICPLGIMQDIISRISKRFNKRKRYKFHTEKKLLRWIILVATTIAFLSGFTFLLGLLDPYGAYGRIATHFLRPAYLYANNLLDNILTSLNNYSLKQVNIHTFGTLSIAIALITFVILSIMAWRNGRIYCNTICPVGTVLGFLSKFSLFKVEFVTEKCNSCGLCSMKCKASCIDTKNMKIDYNRCVDCFNCLDVCNRSAMKYEFVGFPRKRQTANLSNNSSTSNASNVDLSKRRFFSTLLLTGVSAGTLLANKNLPKSNSTKPKLPIAPPGAIKIDKFNEKCISCHLCVSKCPTQIIKPSLLEYGLGGMMQPILSFDNGFCDFNCTVCSDVCPTNALTSITKKDKQHTQIGIAHFVLQNCIVHDKERRCGACAEICPNKAIRMVPYKNSLSIPEINPEICIGCGACEYVCPAVPRKAIYVEGNDIQNVIMK